MSNELGIIAASAILRTEAQSLYPKDNRKDEERRNKYVEDHLHEMHPQVLASLDNWAARQRWHVCNKRWRIFDNDPFLDITLKNILIPRVNLWEDYLITEKTA